MKTDQLIVLASASGVAIIPVAVEQAAMLSALVSQDREHLGAFLPKVATLSTVEAARVHLERAAMSAAEGETFEWHLVRVGTREGHRS